MPAGPKGHAARVGPAVKAAECLPGLSTCRRWGKPCFLEQLFSTGVLASAQQPGWGGPEGLQTAHMGNMFSDFAKKPVRDGFPR